MDAGELWEVAGERGKRRPPGWPGLQVGVWVRAHAQPRR